MTVTRQITETIIETLTLLTLQEYADQSVPEEFRQPLKTIHEALAEHGWDANPIPDDYHPACCGETVECSSFIGSTYLAHCNKCGRFVFDVTGPSFGNSYVAVVDSQRVDLETDMDHRWISGQTALDGAA